MFINLFCAAKVQHFSENSKKVATVSGSRAGWLWLLVG
jgi:hypothetical protein